jgi:hypothetical protein
MTSFVVVGHPDRPVVTGKFEDGLLQLGLTRLQGPLLWKGACADVVVAVMDDASYHYAEAFTVIAAALTAHLYLACKPEVILVAPQEGDQVFEQHPLFKFLFKSLSCVETWGECMQRVKTAKALYDSFVDVGSRAETPVPSTNHWVLQALAGISPSVA